MDELQDASEHPSLDSKLASALLHIAKAHVQWSLQSFCQEQHQQGKVATGRQLLSLFLREFNLDQSHLALFDLHDLMAVQWLGDNGLREFLQRWTYTINKLASRPSNEVLRSVLWHHMKRSKTFQHDMLLFERMDDKDPNKSYEHLLGVLRRQVLREQHERNREQQVRARDPLVSAPAQ
eukprot:6030968-Amphidinium_carterae.1